MIAAGPLHGRTALVTGGASGIGAGIAAGLRAAGTEVITADLAPQAAGDPGLRQLRLDVADAGEVAAARIASPEMLPSGDPLPHLKCSRPGFGGDGHEADQHDNTGRVGAGGVGALWRG